MKLTVLVDNNTLIDKYYYAEPGLSFYIRDGNTKILFDVGYSDIFLRNACKMGINLKNIDYLVLSHGHLDHTWGLIHLTGILNEDSDKKVTLLTHPDAILPKTDNNEQIGFIYSSEVLSNCFNLNLSDSPLWISEKLVYLGQIERSNDFENREPIGLTPINGKKEDDYLLDDSAMVYKSEMGLVIITGCSHSGICNIIEYAKKVCSDDRIYDIVGGLHLQNPPEEQLRETLNYFKKLKPKKIHACHCTDLHSKIALSQVVSLKEVGVGLEIKYD